LALLALVESRKPNVEVIMVKLALTIVACGAILGSTASFAYTLQGNGCGGNGEECKVYCDTGDLAGSMYWNGSVWTDGVKSDPDKDEEAKKICAANGTACT
jgi:hypothetical protein